ncbi:hypothetical protein [Geomicrobium sediminis]|uniref:Antigen I/II N-terminal domain-containing protein n=1 Tax=Geomicrobium sediminis TaxID=1347788 RepID=A0ABS2PF81_9BACL|nr:hypothetical protein [Geomicrobium sediminis]MBM7633636.1 hypothetical protein [Geomicrobium sediminis]
MNKVKLIIGIGALSLMTACGNGGTEEPVIDEADAEEVNVEEEESALNVDESFGSVEITLPPEFIDEETGGGVDEIIANAESEGEEVEQNDDGSLTITMSNADYEEMLSEIHSDLSESMASISDDYESIHEVKHSDDFSDFTFVVNGEQFENSFDGFSIYLAAFGGGLAQVFAGEDHDGYEVVINVEDVESGETLNTVTFPEAFENLQ